MWPLFSGDRVAGFARAEENCPEGLVCPVPFDQNLRPPATTNVSCHSTVVTQPPDTSPPTGFFAAGTTRVDFDASRADGGIPSGVTLTEGRVISTLTYPQPWAVDYAQDSPESDLYDDASHHLTLTFDPQVLGGLPTQVGLVFTDLGQGTGANVRLEAWSGPNRTGTLLATATAFRGQDGTFARNFSDDCFFGIKNAGDIGSIHMTSDATYGGLEADILYYGAIQSSNGASQLSEPISNCEGLSYTGLKPDTVGDVGPNHYVQMVNGASGNHGALAIFSKSGSLLAGPPATDALWNRFDGDCSSR